MESKQELNEEQTKVVDVECLSEESTPLQNDHISSLEKESSKPVKKKKEPTEEKEPLSEELQKALATLEKGSSSEVRIKMLIEFMKERLCISNPSKFREFWEARRLCLAYFKEAMPVRVRGDLWQQYIEISEEARRMKEILDEKSAFAYEQMDLAVQALVEDLVRYQERVAQIPDLQVSALDLSIGKKKGSYQEGQKQLQLLNTLAAKVNSLRKEVIKTDMRIRNKNKLFQKLSECGDEIFPKRKAFIKQISRDFSEDIENFSRTYFSQEEEPKVPLYALREEIKSLQLLAKQLTLNTQAFTQTRATLSSCWEKLKTWEKEKKDNKKQSYEDALIKVKELEEFVKDQTSLSAVQAKYDEMLQAVKAIADLGSFEFRQIKDLLAACKKPLEDKEQEKKAKQQEQERGLEEQRLQKIQDLRAEIEKVMGLKRVTVEKLTSHKEELEEKIKELSLSKAEKMVLDRFTREIKDRILELRSQKLLSLSKSDQEKYSEFQSLIVEKQERRAEVKQQVEAYRKALGGSGFDFEKGMMYRELIESERAVLEKIDSTIQDLQEKQAQLEG